MELAIIASGVLVVGLRNPVHAVISLGLTYLLAGIFLVQSGRVYLGMMLLTVYMGALIVLFIYVIFVCEIGSNSALRQGIWKAVTVCVLLVGGISMAMKTILQTPEPDPCAQTEGAGRLSAEGLKPESIMNQSSNPVLDHNLNRFGEIEPTEYLSIRSGTELSGNLPDMQRIGELIYVEYGTILIYMGMLLLVGMIGAIALVSKKG